MTEAAARQPSTFEFSCDGPGWRGVPIVNGHRILSAESVDVHIDASSFPEVTLRLHVADALKLGLNVAAIAPDDETREALISLGWTPPAETLP